MNAWLVVAPLEQQLIDSASLGTIERVGDLLDQGVAVDSRDGSQWTPLIWASSHGHRAVAFLLLERGANVNAETIARYTPATRASWHGHLDTLKLLVSKGANIHHRDQSGSSSMYWAALRGHLPVCEYLLSLGADLMVANKNNIKALALYGHWANPRPSPTTTALCVTALEAAWAASPHLSQVRRRRWARRGPLLTVLAEHAYRPLQPRAIAIAPAAASLDPAEAVVVQTSRMQDVLRDEGLVRCIVSFL